MPRPLKLIAFAVGGLAGFLALAALVLFSILGVNAKSRMQTLASAALGMEVNIGGRVQTGFFPNLHVTAENVRILNRGSEIASAAQASLGLDLLALLHNEVRMRRVELEHVKISIERQRDGRFNFETQSEPRGTILAAHVARVSLSDAALVYTDRQSGQAFEAQSCNVDGRHLQLSGKQGAGRLKRLSLTAALACGQIRTRNLVLSDVKTSIDGKDGIFDLKPITLRVFGGQGTGDIRANFSGPVPAYQARFALSKFQLAEFSKALSPRKVGNGLMDFSASLSMNGTTTDEMLRSAKGEASLRGRDLALDIDDIDQSFSRHGSSRNSNGGRPDVGPFPRLQLAAENVRIRNRGSEIASVAQASLGLDLFALLLHNEVRMDTVELQHAKISIELQRDGRFNFETRSEPGGTLVPAQVGTVSLSDAGLVYTDRQSGRGFEAQSCNVDGRHLQLSGKQGAGRLKRLSFTAALACGQIRTKDLVLSDVKTSIDGKDGIFDLKPITLRVFGGQGTGDIRANFSGSVPTYQARFALSKFQLAEFSSAVSPKKVGNGLMDFSASLSMKGRTTDEMLRSAEGKASLRGRDLTLDIGDVDQAFSRYEASQTFNLVDLGALFFAGPFGLAVTKGYSLARSFTGLTGTSHIRTLVSEWDVKRGVAQAKDVAMATQQNRIALKGGLDFVNERFQEVTVALVDAQGCSRMQQDIRGPFSKPEVEAPSALASLTGPVRKLLGAATNILGGRCDRFYAGAVAPPR